MIPLDEYIKALGDTAKGFTEEQILKLRENQDHMAEIMFNMWTEEKKKASSNKE